MLAKNPASFFLHSLFLPGRVTAALTMALFFCLIMPTPSFAQGASTAASTEKKEQKFYDLSATDFEGKKVHFSSYRGKVVLVVNTASQCGFTPQLADLESLYKKYAKQGFVVLAFPSNDFKQESGSNKDVVNFAHKEYKTTFPFFEKGAVTGANKQPVYQFLTEKKSGFLFKEVGWNFEKFLISRQGDVIERWGSMTRPTSGSVTAAIEKALKDPL